MIYITLTNWRKVAETTAAKNENLRLKNKALIDELDKAAKSLKGLRHKSYVQDEAGKWRDSVNGQYVSPKEVMTAQLRAEREASELYKENQPSDNCCLGHYDDIKKASKK